MAALCSYKLKLLLFSRLFSFECLKFQLDRLEKFKIFNLFAFLGFCPQLLALYSCLSAIIYSNCSTEELLIICDCLFLVFASMVLSLTVVRKDPDFF